MRTKKQKLAIGARSLHWSDEEYMHKYCRGSWYYLYNKALTGHLKLHRMINKIKYPARK